MDLARAQEILDEHAQQVGEAAEIGAAEALEAAKGDMDNIAAGAGKAPEEMPERVWRERLLYHAYRPSMDAEDHAEREHRDRIRASADDRRRERAELERSPEPEIDGDSDPTERSIL